jgi:molybdate transport system ATP-binding protein
MIDLTALGGLENRHPRELSGGQQQRVALARALAFRPDVLLLDEPFSSLDSSIRGELREELLALQRRAGVTTVVVTHDLEDAFLLGQRMAVIDDGRVLQEGSREEIFYRPESRRVAEFVRTRNVLRGTVLSVDDVTLRIDWRGRVLEAPPQPLVPGTSVDVCIRPTQIMIVRLDRPAAELRQNTLYGCIVRESIQAETYRLFLRLEPPEPASAVTGSDPAEDLSGTDGRPAGHDLEIELPGYVYFRLGLDQRRDITVSIRQDVLHVIPSTAD